MKNAQKIQMLTLVVIALIVTLVSQWKPTPLVHPRPTVVSVRPLSTRREVRRTPEFRPAPVKTYKPGRSHQMGVLTDGTTTLPLYGRVTRGHRDRYHYWTTTGVTNLFSVPITHDGRDCVEDIGCREFYGGEQVSVTGKTNPFDVTLYRTDDFF